MSSPKKKRRGWSAVPGRWSRRWPTSRAGVAACCWFCAWPGRSNGVSGHDYVATMVWFCNAAYLVRFGFQILLQFRLRFGQLSTVASAEVDRRQAEAAHRHHLADGFIVKVGALAARTQHLPTEWRRVSFRLAPLPSRIGSCSPARPSDWPMSQPRVSVRAGCWTRAWAARRGKGPAAAVWLSASVP